MIWCPVNTWRSCVTLCQTPSAGFASSGGLSLTILRDNRMSLRWKSNIIMYYFPIFIMWIVFISSHHSSAGTLPLTLGFLDLTSSQNHGTLTLQNLWTFFSVLGLDYWYMLVSFIRTGSYCFVLFCIVVSCIVGLCLSVTVMQKTFFKKIKIK